MSDLDWNNAGDHTHPCPFSRGGAYDSSKVFCTCDLSERMIHEYNGGGLSLQIVKPAYAEIIRRKRLKKLVDKAIDEALDSFTHNTRR